MRIAVNYHFHPRFRVLDWQTNRMVPPPLLHINDASLEWGGKFDIKEYGQAHMRNTSAAPVSICVPMRTWARFRRNYLKNLTSG